MQFRVIPAWIYFTDFFLASLQKLRPMYIFVFAYLLKHIFLNKNMLHFYLHFILADLKPQHKKKTLL